MWNGIPAPAEQLYDDADVYLLPLAEGERSS
jgi:hypothetical protein